MEKLPKISIIVPCYNQAQYLDECLQSVLDQTYQNWECIIVNDGSPDNTEEVALAWTQKDSRFKYVKKENGGLSSARNAGIKNSVGEYILPLDADDKISEDYIQLGIQRFIDYPETKLVYCAAELFGEETGIWNLKEYSYENLLFANMIFCSAIYKRKDFDKTKGYNENFKIGLEDWDFWITLLSPMDIVYKIPKVCFYYRIKNVSMLKNVTTEKWQRVARQIVINHKDKYEQYFSDIIYLQNQKEIIKQLSSEIERLKKTRAYRLGKFILKPFNAIKKLF